MNLPLSLALVAALAASPALAQADPPHPGQEGASDQARPVPAHAYPAQTFLGEEEFGILGIEGELVRPQGAVVFTPRHSSFPSWIALRTDFDAELRESVEQIR